MYQAVEQNLRAAMRGYSCIGSGAEAREYPGLVLASSGLNVPVFNSAMLTEPTASVEPLVTLADVHFQARRLGWTFWLCEDMVTGGSGSSAVGSVFANNRMLRIANPPGMYAEHIEPHVRKPALISFAPVDDDKTRLEFAHVASVVFTLPFETSKRIYGAPGFWTSPTNGWIGYFEGKPVSVVTTVIAAGAVGVYSLGTLPQHQGCGFGETLLRHALEDARQRSGLQTSVLQAAPQGLRLYLRMGYRIVTRFSIFMREACA
jgi:ribosomal protein S18 acetylase RimI-like enzyme